MLTGPDLSTAHRQTTVSRRPRRPAGPDRCQPCAAVRPARPARRLSVTEVIDPGGTGFLPFTLTRTPAGFPMVMLTGRRSIQFIALPAYTVPLKMVWPVAVVS